MTDYNELQAELTAKKAAGWQCTDGLSIDTVLALIAENERLLNLLERTVEQHVPLTELEGVPGWSRVVELVEVVTERDQLRAEIAGLKTGYEAYEQVNAELKAENEALRKDAERWRFFSVLANDLQAFPHAWGKMTPEKMDAMCDQAMADAAMSQGEQS
ncbi:hypothetical protein [Pseudomonas sp. B16120]|uniref:hypothetical protein n=1 Tax=Pseudomonas sp. B16120 TaxID=3235108 RepID=UPI0037832396